MRVTTGLGSHLYALIRVMPITTGPVLEMGVGLNSTPFLHWACLNKRKLMSYESDPKYLRLFRGYATKMHEMTLVEDYSQADIEKPWDVALIDHHPNERRKEDIKRLAGYVKYLVVHDTNPKLEHAYHYIEIYPLFKYRVDYPVARTHVSVLSNFVDVGFVLG